MADDQDLALWKHLAEESKAGRIDLDSSVSNDCLKACEQQLEVYRRIRLKLRNVSNVSGLGDFPASDALAKMFGLKAVGGDDDFDSAVAKHFEVLEQIRDTIKYSVERLVEHDQSQADAISKK